VTPGGGNGTDAPPTQNINDKRVPPSFAHA
jgi:hypothetical protein